jgi:cytochrome c oxidase assembly protein subunit 15
MPALLRLSILSSGLALVVIVFGAYVRLSDAGLSCPDWPGCYGQLLVPSGEQGVALAESAYPLVPLESGKAWKEMTHRYLAGLLGIAIATIAFLSWRNRKQPGHPHLLPVLLVVLVIFQALLGMWTVTLQLKPAIVTAHLLGGLLTITLLVWLSLRYWALSRGWVSVTTSHGLHRTLSFGLVALLIQLALGGWTSANYAALACPDFPLCNASLWPTMDLSEGFQLRRELGRNTDGQFISQQGLVSIHFIHRLGALVTIVFLSWASLLGFRQNNIIIRAGATTVLVLLAAQVTLGVSLVLNARPLGFAVLHNANAALLLLSVVYLLFVTRRQRTTLIQSKLHSVGA